MHLETPEPIHEDRVWSDERWTARVIKNEDDDGWAVAMYLRGQAEPALVGPWTMGRDKKNPKPLDTSAFNTLVKTAQEVIRRSEQQRHAELNKSVNIHVDGQPVRVALAIVPDEEAGEYWERDPAKCNQLSENFFTNIADQPDHLMTAGSTWPENPNCI